MGRESGEEMSETLHWRGRPVDELTRLELIEALRYSAKELKEWQDRAHREAKIFTARQKWPVQRTDFISKEAL